MSSLAISSHKNDTEKQWQFILLPGKICDVSSFITQNYKQMGSIPQKVPQSEIFVFDILVSWYFSQINLAG